MTDYSALIKRLAEGDGPDRRLDWDIALAFGVVFGVQLDGGERWSFFDDQNRLICGGCASKSDGGFGPANTDYQFTSSLDATVALIERELPGCSRWIRNYSGEVVVAGIVPNPWPADDDTPTGKAASEPRALLTALLKAKQAEGA